MPQEVLTVARGQEVRLASDTRSLDSAGLVDSWCGVCEVNPCLILSYNNLPALKKCVESVRRQDIPAYLGVIDNGSVDGSVGWLKQERIPGRHNEKNIGVSAGWNQGLDILFGDGRVDHVLVLNQDLQLPSSAYRELLDFNVPFVTGFPVQTEFVATRLAQARPVETAWPNTAA